MKEGLSEVEEGRAGWTIDTETQPFIRIWTLKAKKLTINTCSITGENERLYSKSYENFIYVY